MSNRIQKIDQLDSVRAFAAFAVILHHYLVDYEIGHLPFGWIGVDVFFTISGFLITAILLKQKGAIQNRLLIIKNFVIKRALRLFPLYYLYITFFFVLSLFGLYVWDKGDGAYFFTYTQNFLFFFEGEKGKQVNHLWTLAVEEQFYLLWPWVLLYVPNRKLIWCLLAIIPSTLIFKSFVDVPYLKMLPFAHFDTLGAGALVALLIHQEVEGWVRIPLVAPSFAGIVISVFFPNPFIISISILGLSIGLVTGCYYGFGGSFGYILNLRFLNYLGKISYGLYVLHKPIPYFVHLIAGKLNFDPNNIFVFLLSLGLTVIVAHLSYKFIEQRFLRIKERFDL